MSLNAKLILVALVLLVGSLFTYRQSVTRAERFERGQKFLSQLNPDNIHQIEIVKDGETVLLRKSEDAFLVSSSNNYPAKNESINRFIKEVLDLSLEKNVGEGESLEKELELVDSENAILVTLRNDAGKNMVRFRVGKSSDDGSGNYVRRLDDEDSAIYLTSKGVYLSSSDDSFLDKDLVDLQESDIAKIEGKDFVFSRNDSDALVLENLPKGKKESSAASQLKGGFANLRFEKVFLADDAVVSDLNFAEDLVVTMTDETKYHVSHANKDDVTYVRIKAEMDEAKVREAAGIRADESEEQLKAKSEILTRYDAVKEFNQLAGSWVYELSSYNAGRLFKTKADLVEDEASEDE